MPCFKTFREIHPWSSSRVTDGYNLQSQPRMKLWKQENTESFLQNFNSLELSRITQVISKKISNDKELQRDYSGNQSTAPDINLERAPILLKCF